MGNEATQNGTSLSFDQAYSDRFSGVGRVYGKSALEIFARSHACVIGIGGVGSWSAEAMARSGIGEITLVDLDELCVTNINRQIHALTDTVGLSKVEVMKKRLLEINPALKVNAIQRFFTEKSQDDLLGTVVAPALFDVVIDAIDQTTKKALLIEACLARSIPVVTCGAAGGRRAPHLITTSDLQHSTHDGLLRRVKKLLRRGSVLNSKDQSSWGIPAVFSTERAYYPTPTGDVCHIPPSHEALRLDCSAGFGSLCFVTGTFGFVTAHQALEQILTKNEGK